MINILSKDTIDKIAAGEVAERPESVVKELLDNAIDAGSDAVSIEVRGGGLDLIRVTDNGSGIEKSDVRTAFLRHATSKLRTAEDIEHVMTMGFRGEALASIAAVSDVELITRTHGDLAGVQYRIEFGRETYFGEIGVPEGTTVIVRDFLMNVPVRRQFLKSPQLENSYISDTVEKIALAHPEISISLNCDGRNVFASSGSGRLRDVIYIIYGQAAAASLIEVDTDKGAAGESAAVPHSRGLRVSGYIAKPVISRGRRDCEVFFVNSRWIRSDILRKAAEDAYAPFMMQHKYPLLVLNVDLPPEEVDVNVHPRKTEVRFASGQKLYDAVYECISSALKQSELVVNAGDLFFLKDKASKNAYSTPLPSGAAAAGAGRTAETGGSGDAEKPAAGEYQQSAGKGAFGRELTGTGKTAVNDTPADAGKTAAGKAAAGAGSIPEPFEKKRKYDYVSSVTEEIRKAEGFSAGAASAQNISAGAMSAEGTKEKPAVSGSSAPESSTESGGRKFLDPASVPYFRLVGQVFETYWIIEYNNEMYIIDQHAAHEKVNYERYMALIRKHAVESQYLFPPIVLTLGAREAVLFEKCTDDFAELGYEIEYAGDRDFIVRAVPSNLPEMGDEAVLMSLVESLSEEGRALNSGLLRDKVASMSCKAAVKGNMQMSEAEVKALISELLTLDNPYACPHGRPTIVKWSRSDLEKLFKRIVN